MAATADAACAGTTPRGASMVVMAAARCTDVEADSDSAGIVAAAECTALAAVAAMVSAVMVTGVARCIAEAECIAAGADSVEDAGDTAAVGVDIANIAAAEGTVECAAVAAASVAMGSTDNAADMLAAAARVAVEDLVVGGKADPAAGSANGVAAVVDLVVVGAGVLEEVDRAVSVVPARGDGMVKDSVVNVSPDRVSAGGASAVDRASVAGALANSAAGDRNVVTLTGKTAIAVSRAVETAASVADPVDRVLVAAVPVASVAAALGAFGIAKSRKAAAASGRPSALADPTVGPVPVGPLRMLRGAARATAAIRLLRQVTVRTVLAPTVVVRAAVVRTALVVVRATVGQAVLVLTAPAAAIAATRRARAISFSRFCFD